MPNHDIRKAPSYPSYESALASWKADQSTGNGKALRAAANKCLEEVGVDKRYRI